VITPLPFFTLLLLLRTVASSAFAFSQLWPAEIFIFQVGVLLSQAV
jgi:hypothetical protein